MELFLMRHGEAKDGHDDTNRPLSETGRIHVKNVALSAQMRGINPPEIFHSSKLRAKETAELFAKTLQADIVPQEATGLKPNDDIRDWIQEVEKRESPLMLVGHLPYMELFVSMLLTGYPNKRVVDFFPATLACLQKKPDYSWELTSIIRPENQ
ncbi:MAG: phosphohistidine phosphatase SixA [Nitrospinae bacterium]|nr:phosphohistidine phosphatase SixA [Nitrospinota bacterium]